MTRSFSLSRDYYQACLNYFCRAHAAFRPGAGDKVQLYITPKSVEQAWGLKAYVQLLSARNFVGATAWGLQSILLLRFVCSLLQAGQCISVCRKPQA